MIEWKKLFTPVASLDGEEARKFLAQRQEGTYTLLDVRQPWEYEEDHLPGAQLMPLAELNSRLDELDRNKPALVYCAVGGRSRVAAQLMSGQGFEEIYNLSGGIKGYRGTKAQGPQELHLDLVREDDSPRQILILACGMEKALQIFYETIKARTTDEDLAKLSASLGHMEEKHQERLLARYQEMLGETVDRPAFDARTGTEILEGGFKLQEFLKTNEPWLKSSREVLELALMMETQALDLYLRLAAKLTDTEGRELLFSLAQEEKGHLAALARLLDDRRPAVQAGK
jgi:rhodanese-related sulfurtransferase